MPSRRCLGHWEFVLEGACETQAAVLFPPLLADEVSGFVCCLTLACTKTQAIGPVNYE